MAMKRSAMRSLDSAHLDAVTGGYRPSYAGLSPGCAYAISYDAETAGFVYGAVAGGTPLSYAGMRVGARRGPWSTLALSIGGMAAGMAAGSQVGEWIGERIARTSKACKK